MSGLFGFEPAVGRAFEYECVGAGTFVTEGNRRGVQAGAGPATGDAHTLLHVYSNVPWFMNDMPEAGTLDELAARWSGK